MTFGAILLWLAVAATTCDAHRGAWASHSVRQSGGPADARTFAGCERLNRRHPRSFSTHRCKHKVYWDRKYRELPDYAKGWLFRTRLCESGNGRDEHGGGLYHGRYQYAPTTAYNAGYRDPQGNYFDPHRAYPHEDDVRTWRWKLRAGSSQWPNCAPW